MWFHTKGKLQLLSDSEIYDSLDDLQEGSVFRTWKRGAQDSQDYDWTFENKLNISIVNELLTKVQICLKPNQNTDDMQLRINFLRNDNDDGSISLWYDFCRVKLAFVNENGVATLSRYVHVEPNSKDSTRDHGSKPTGEEKTFGTFFDKSFCPLTTAQEPCQWKTTQFCDRNGSTQVERVEFISLDVDILIHFREQFSVPGRQIGGSLKFVLWSNSEWMEDPPLKSLHPNSDFADMIFKVGPNLNEQLSAHRSVLAANSPVFKSMLQLDMKEKATGIIELEDVSPEVMTEFLGFMYGNNPGTSVEPPMGKIRTYLELLKVAHKFQVEALIDHCVGSIIGNTTIRFTVKQTLDMYAAGHLYDIPDLKFRSLQSYRKLRTKFDTPEGKNQLDSFIQANGAAVYLPWFTEVYRPLDLD